MRKFLSALFKKISEILEKEEPTTEIHGQEEHEESVRLTNIKKEKSSKQEDGKQDTEDSKELLLSLVLPQQIPPKCPARDIMNLMDYPFLALSKNRKKPIVYESQDGTRKTIVSCHSNHYLASIYDWDIIVFVAGKIQEILNNMTDIPPRTIIIPRHEILKALHKHNVNTQQKSLKIASIG